MNISLFGLGLQLANLTQSWVWLFNIYKEFSENPFGQ